MTIQTVDTDYGRVSYRESGGSGPPVVFIHGNSSSSETWAPQLDSALGAIYRCIAVDLPGHGLSDRLGSPADYTLGNYARAIAAVTERLGADACALVGWSLGGHIALEALTIMADLRGVAVFGTPPVGIPPRMEDAFHPQPTMELRFTADIGPDHARAWAETLVAPGSTIDLEAYIDDILATDGAARAGLAASVAALSYTDELELVAGMSQPLAILQGASEQLVPTEYLEQVAAPTLWRGQVQIIEHAGHVPHHEVPEDFNAILLNFLADLDWFATAEMSYPD